MKTQKMFSLYFYQLNKSDLTNYSFSVQTFIEMGFEHHDDYKTVP